MLYLASSSPRRIEILSWTGLPFEVVEHTVDESEVKAENGEDLVAELSILKASSPNKKVKGLVIGSDLTVELEGKLIGKPKDKIEAKQMLSDLRDKTHLVFTGIAVVDTETGEGRLSVCKNEVSMKNYSDDLILRYVKEFEVMDKGGAYSIRYKIPGYGSLVKDLKGSFTNVLGFPIHYLDNLLTEFGVKIKKDWRKKCKLETGYEY
jgi:nucleoside triphosphate pyrophosphatase